MLAFEILPELHGQVESQALAEAVEQHLVQTRRHAENVEAVFRHLEAHPSSRESPPLLGLQSLHEEVAGMIAEPRLADLFHAAAAARTEHYELAAYDNLLTLAKTLGAGEAEKLLEANRKEEEQALKEVEQIAERLRGDLP
jgi:ferritin-like metal-binding protein YciE